MPHLGLTFDLTVKRNNEPWNIKLYDVSPLNKQFRLDDLAVPKLHNDGSNWDDYKPHIQRTLGSKGLWRHVEGTSIAPKLYVLVASLSLQME